MRLCLFVVFALFLGTVHCNVGIINGTGIERLYSKLLDRMIRILQNQVEKKKNLSPEDEDRISCISGLNALFRNLGSSWGLAMIDSASKLQSGIVSWNFMDLGDYDQCINVKVGPTEENPELPKFTGRHCLVTNRIYTTNGTVELNGENLTLMDVFGQPYIPLTLAHCYPSLCKPYIIQEALNGVLSLLEHDFEILGLGISENITVDPKDCQNAEGTTYDALDWIVLIIILFFVLLGLISTAIDYFYFKSNNKNPSSSTVKLLGSFSFYTNTKKLLSVATVPEIIPSLNGLKFLSICWVIFTHEYMFISLFPIRNLNQSYATGGVLRELAKMIIMNGSLSVDTFFFISGLLNVYGFLTLTTTFKRYTVKDVLKGYIHRYLRLTPAYLMMIGFTATWSYHLRDGPLWNRFVPDMKDFCRQKYWANILYINNYFPYCMIHSWYLATDMQLFWLSPFVMYPLWKWPKYGWAQFWVLIVASIISPFLVSWYGHIAAPMPRTSDFNRKTQEYLTLYLPLHTRFGSYLLGIGAGCILFQYRKGTLKLDLSLRKRIIGWLLSATMMLYAIFGGYEVFQMDYNYNRLFSAFYIGFLRFFWPAGLFWLVLMCVTGYGGFINTFLSWKVFTPLSKICYCIFLTHIVIVMCGFVARRNSFYFDNYDQMEKFLGDTVMSVFSGLVLTLLVEMPMLNIEKLFFGSGRKELIEGRRSNSSPPTKL